MSYPNIQDLTDVNQEINDNNRYVPDLTQYGVPDLWTDIRETGDGDCEDYGVAKLRRLLDLGWPIEALRLAICTVEEFQVPDGTGGMRPATIGERCHGVLVVDHQGQTWVLDNRKVFPIEYQLSGYTFQYVQVPGKPWMEKVA